MSKLLDRYQIYLYAQKIKIPAIYWVAIFFVFALIIGGSLFLVDNRIGLLLFAVILDLGVGVPVYLYNAHVIKIERYWPDALRLVADTMKAGASFDFALREVCSADFGPLSFEINDMIRRLEMGETMHQALDYLALRIDSKIVRRTVTLIQESLRTGAPLADVLEEIANDTKYMFRIKKERKTKTLLQTIFIFAAGGVIAPFIFGLTTVITEFLTTVATTSGVANSQSIAMAASSQTTIFLLLDIYILIEVIAASAMISLMKNGKLNDMFIYFPIMITVAYTVYLLSQFALRAMLSGMI